MASDAVTGAEVHSRPRSILLIEDDPVFAAALSRSVARHGLVVEHYASFPDLGYVGNIGRFAAVVVDYRLPDVNGPEIAGCVVGI